MKQLWMDKIYNWICWLIHRFARGVQVNHEEHADDIERYKEAVKDKPEK